MTVESSTGAGAVEGLKTKLDPFGPTLRRFQETLNVGPISLEKIQEVECRKPGFVDSLVDELQATEDASRPTPELEAQLRKFAAYTKSGSAFRVRSAEGNRLRVFGHTNDDLRKGLLVEFGKRGFTTVPRPPRGTKSDTERDDD